MRIPAWCIKAVGSPDVFYKTQVDLPELLPSQVLIKVVASGFNPVDTKIRAGLATIAPENGVLGSDVSGYVEQLGSDVTMFNVGDAIFGCAGGVRGHGGALSQYMICEAALVAHAPKSISLKAASGLPIPAITAQHLKRRLHLKEGDDVCVLGATGSVGQLISQLAKLEGCSVLGTGGSLERLTILQALNIEGVLHEVAGRHGEMYSKVIDTFGGPSFIKALQLAKPFGQVATINARGQHDLSAAHAKALTMHAIFMLLPLLSKTNMQYCAQDLTDIAQLIDSAQLKALSVNTVPMSNVADVHKEYEAGHINTKTVFVADF